MDNFSDLDDCLIDYIEATNIFNEKYAYNFEIRFKKEYLYFSENVGVKKGQSRSFWLPIDTPYFKRNLNEQEVKDFFSQDNVPADVLKLVGADNSEMLEILNL